MIKLVLKSLKESWSEKRMWLLLFLFSLIPALFFGLLFYNNAKSVGGNSLAMDRLFGGFDFMTFSDFMKEGGDTIKPIFLWSLLGGLIFLIINIFLSGGVVERAVNTLEKYSLGSFMKHASKRFPRFLLVYLLVAVLAFCLFLACGLLYFIATLLAENGNDKSLTIWLSVPTVFLILSMTFSICVSDYTKVLLTKYPFLDTAQAFSKAIAYVWKRPKTLGSLWLLIILGALSLALYLLLDKTIGMTTTIGVLIMILIQQIYSFFRIFIRFSHLKVANNFYDNDPLNIQEPIIPAPEETIEEDSLFDENPEPPQAEDGLEDIPEKE